MKTKISENVENTKEKSLQKLQQPFPFQPSTANTKGISRGRRPLISPIICAHLPLQIVRLSASRVVTAFTVQPTRLPRDSQFPLP